jgi:hypothetical protein
VLTEVSPLNQLPPPLTVRERMGRLYRELALLRRLLRLSQAARDERANQDKRREESHA